MQNYLFIFKWIRQNGRKNDFVSSIERLHTPFYYAFSVNEVIAIFHGEVFYKIAE